MISPDIRIEGFDAQSWGRLLSLFSTAPADLETSAEQALLPNRPEGTLVVIVDDQDRTLRALHTGRGALTGVRYGGSESLPLLARDHGVKRCVVIREGVPEEIAERLAVRLQPGDDYASQWLSCVRILREVQSAGMMRVWPRPLASVPIPAMTTLQRALDMLLPDDHCWVLALWSGTHLWTTFVVHRHRGQIATVVGPDRIRQWTGPLGGDFRRDYRHIVRAVSTHLAPVHFGAFTDVGVLDHLLHTSHAGTWAKHVAARDIIVHPTPPYAMVVLGADAVGGAARRAAKWAGGLDMLKLLRPVVRELRSQVTSVSSVTEILGFNPIQIWSQWRQGRDAQDG